MSLVFRDAFVDPIRRPLGCFACGSAWGLVGVLFEPATFQGLLYIVVQGSGGSVAARVLSVSSLARVASGAVALETASAYRVFVVAVRF